MARPDRTGSSTINFGDSVSVAGTVDLDLFSKPLIRFIQWKQSDRKGSCCDARLLSRLPAR